MMNMKVSSEDFPRVMTEGRFLPGGKFHRQHCFAFWESDFTSTKDSLTYLLPFANFSVWEQLFSYAKKQRFA